MGRKSEYTEEIANKICERMAEGNSLLTICSSDDMPCMSTVFKWLTENKDFSDNYTRAWHARADAKFEELDEVSEQAVNAESAVTVAGLRLKADNIKWQTARMNARKYGDKVTLAGDKENPLQVEQTLDVSKLSTAALSEILAAKNETNNS